MANARARQLRSNQTDAEKKLWRSLRLLKSRGFHFRRQVPIEGLIVDFACYSARLVIEVDGGQHNEGKGQQVDKQRDALLRQNNFRVLRFWNHDVLRNTEGVMETIVASLPPPPTPPRKGEGSGS
jgi:very-short-patch-repair endonuclease